MYEAADEAEPEAGDADARDHFPLLIVEEEARLHYDLLVLAVLECEVVGEGAHKGAVRNQVDEKGRRLLA